MSALTNNDWINSVASQQISYPASGIAPVITITVVLNDDLSAIELDSYMSTEISVNWTYEYVYNGVSSSQYYTDDT